jgi:hypothetical protein
VLARGKTWSADRPDRLPDRLTVKSGRDGESGSLAEPGEQRKAPSSLGGEQSPWKYRVWNTGNGGLHYGLVGGATPWSRSALAATTVRSGTWSVGGGAECERGVPSGAHRSKGTDAVKARAPGNRRRRWVQSELRARQNVVLRCDGLWRACSPDGMDQPSSVRMTTRQVPASAGAGSGPCGGRPSGRTNTRCLTAQRARLATAGGRGERIGGGNAMSRFRPGQARSKPTCTPGTRRREWNLWTKHGRSLRHLGARRRHQRDCFGNLLVSAAPLRRR